MSENRFYICEHCGNIIGMIKDAGVKVVCCGHKMTALIPGAVEASAEKHLPKVSISEDGKTVTAAVGSVMHPMSAEHSISWIYLETDRGGQRKALSPNEEPTAKFALCDEKPVAVYAYCNLHGLWKTEI